jgi:class 3 adenylate cyclase
MEPRIQYAQTSDGVSIAFWTIGEGPPILWLPGSVAVSNSFLWRIEGSRRQFERLSATRKLIQLDFRGMGDSDRDPPDRSLEAYGLDIEAVAGRLALDRFALVGPLWSGPVAIACAARLADRVSHLVLSGTAAQGSDLFTPQMEALLRLADVDWEMYTDTLVQNFFGVVNAEDAAGMAAHYRQTTTLERLRASVEAMRKLDAAPFLQQVTAPTLVLHWRGSRMPDVRAARQLASQIRNARLALTEERPFTNPESEAQTIDDFLSEGEETEGAPELPSGTAIILFADIVDSTVLTERLGDAAFRAKARELDGALRVIIRNNNGTPVEGKLLGDGVLAVFTSARQAIEAALACGTAGAEGGLPLHLGLHAGDVIREENNVYGGPVNIAARIASLSAPGELLVSDTVRSLARTSAGVSFEDRGEQALKGIEEPVRVYEVRWRD